MSSGLDGEDVVALSVISFFLASIAAFLTHIWWIIGICMAGNPVTGGQVVLAIFGIIFPPFGVVHGFWLWLH